MNALSFMLNGNISFLKEYNKYVYCAHKIIEINSGYKLIVLCCNHFSVIYYKLIIDSFNIYNILFVNKLI